MGNVSRTNNTRIFTLNELSLRLSPALADEIGLNESIMLLQIEYWISISDHFLNDHRWTYQSVRQMQEKAFAFWSIATVSRTAKSLLDKGLIIEGNYNKKTYDNTRWFALNYRELSKLKSIMIRGYEGEGSETPPFQIETPLLLQDETPLFQNETPLLQDETPLFQIETTIPQITPENTPHITPQNYLADEDADSAQEQEDCLPETERFAFEHKEQVSPATGKAMGLRAIEFAEINLKRELSYYEREQIRNWCKQFGEHRNCQDPESIVIAGLERCVIKNDLSSLIAYLNSILEDYQENNVVTLEQAYGLYEKRKNSQKRAHVFRRVNGSGEGAEAQSEVGKGLKTEKYANFYL
ncbi:DnaD domain-containing protein [Desulfosporosinus shakirovi]|uniref:DnaD domain-containing protein n=1 Tax=Desulfosporosinus shakirovi TaxID=2885154 RepID=UPI001E43FFEC|nr:DnaD domain protein [Desulfosporosinus sp. SRJS8]MCB8818681.1 DnaD domain protein [Desulfosporosinus sp. SRJS8]